MTKRQDALLVRLETWFDESGGGRVLEASNALHMPVQAAEAVVKIGIHENRVARIGDRVMTVKGLAAIYDRLHAKFGLRTFHPRELRETLGDSRQGTDQLADTFQARGWLDRDEEGWRLKQRP